MSLLEQAAPTFQPAAPRANPAPKGQEAAAPRACPAVTFAGPPPGAHACLHPRLSALRQPLPTLLPVPSDPSGFRRMDFESLLLQTREKETLPGALLSAHPRDVGGSPKPAYEALKALPGLALLVAQGELLGLSEPLFLWLFK